MRYYKKGDMIKSLSNYCESIKLGQMFLVSRDSTKTDEVCLLVRCNVGRITEYRMDVKEFEKCDINESNSNEAKYIKEWGNSYLDQKQADEIELKIAQNRKTQQENCERGKNTNYGFGEISQACRDTSVFVHTGPARKGEDVDGEPYERPGYWA